MIREEIDFNVEIKPDAHRILADAGQIEQIVMNLVLNARDAITGAGTLTLQGGSALADGLAEGASFRSQISAIKIVPTGVDVAVAYEVIIRQASENI